MIGSVFRLGWGQVVGGIAFGAGLTVLSSTISSRITVREQYAKEANLKRKDDYYGPLHADLKALRERLEIARSGESSYPLWITGTGQKEPTGRHMIDDALTLAKWVEFRTDYRTDNFTLNACRVLDGVIEQATTYNAVIDAARAPTIGILEPVIAKAVELVARSTEFREWQQRRAEQIKASRNDPDDEAKWFGSLVNGLSPDLDPSVPQRLASAWVDGWSLYRPETLGWLLAGHANRAALCLDGSLYTPGSRPAAPPVNWRQSVFESALLSLNGDQSYEQTRHAAHGLFDAVLTAERLLNDGLLYIRDRYEGGRPIV